MRFSAVRDSHTRDTTFTLVITDADYCCARFYEWDHTLFYDCKRSNSIADKLLALETLARRIEDSRTVRAASTGEGTETG